LVVTCAFAEALVHWSDCVALIGLAHRPTRWVSVLGATFQPCADRLVQQTR
jgi:hypothetical protein